MTAPDSHPPQAARTSTRNRTTVTILRRRQVEFESGYSRSTIYLRITQGLWPRPISLGARAVGWPASEVTALNLARITGMSDAEIRSLVIELQTARKTAGLPLAGGAE